MKKSIKINNETGLLRTVVLHKPGREIENMVPKNAQRALYSDILNLSVASAEYNVFESVLKHTTDVFYITNLLTDILRQEELKQALLHEVCQNENVQYIPDLLRTLDNLTLAKLLIEGIPLRKDNLTNYLNPDKYILKPLNNFFFVRDTAFCINNTLFVSNMANNVREREAILVKYIFRNHNIFKSFENNIITGQDYLPGANIEGGDVIIAKDDVILFGLGARTNALGIDSVINKLKERKPDFFAVIQELPIDIESFIHLDMVFTIIDSHVCLVYNPLLTQKNRFQTFLIQVSNGEVIKIEQMDSFPKALKRAGLDFNFISCGGDEPTNQEREQWHSGANFFSIGKGKIMGYSRNKHTLEALNKKGFEIIDAKMAVDDINKIYTFHSKVAITIEGSELSRGGGGCRCMTLPLLRDS
jgi:arginine deiminase